MSKSVNVFAVLLAASLAAGCATWSTDSVKPAASTRAAAAPVAATSPDAIVVTENDITDRPYTVLGDVNVTVHKTTIFNKDPTRDQVNQELREKAAKLGADAVVLVRYGTVGVGVTSWGELDGQGRAVKFR